MKIAFLSHLDLNLYLFRTPIMKALLEKGHKVYAICPKGDKNEALKEMGCEVINYEIERKSLNPFKEKIAINNIYYSIKDLNLDILHTFTAKPNIYGTLAAKKANVPTIFNLVEGLGSFYINNSLKNVILRTIIEYLYKKIFKISTACIFVNSDDPKYMVQKNIIQPSKVKIIKSVGVDTKYFSMQHFNEEKIKKLKSKYNLEEKKVVLMVSRAIWDKGIREYYTCASLIKEVHSQVVFLLVGDIDNGNHTAVSREFLQQGDVLWLGHRDNIAELIALSDIFVLPSYREGIPRTLLEAASMQKPIVTTDAPGCREVVENAKNGFLVPIKDSFALAQKVEYLLKNPEVAQQFGVYGRKKVKEEFSVEKVVKQYMEIYSSV